MKDLIPKTTEPMEVEITDIEEHIPTDDEIVKALQAEGFAKMTDVKLRLWQRLGVHVNGHGIIKNQRGVAFLTQLRMNEVVEILHRLLIEGVDRPRRKKGQPREEARLTVEQACQLAHEAAFAASKLTESQELMNKLRPQSQYQPTPLPNDQPVASSFPAGAIVIGNSNVTVTQRQDEEQKPVAKP